MELEAAKKLVERVFNSRYSNDNFIDLISNIFKSYDRQYREITLPDDQKNFLQFNFLGSYDSDGDEIGIYEIKLSNRNTLNRARVAQRNIVANQLRNSSHSSAIVSYYAENTNEWRFSFVQSEILIDESSKRLKFIEQFTPSRRQSFLAGPNEGTHTAKLQILPILCNTELPSLKDIELIFKIEPVNDDFYDQYKELYLNLTDYLNDFIKQDDVIARDFKEKEVLPSDFAKKTLGQFIFLYFIQKKGWIKDLNNPELEFSISELFSNRSRYGDNFFNDLIEPIFYESLAKEESTNNKYEVIKAFSFPYLNGGLFEPIRGYDWEKTNIVIPDSFFKNQNETKNGDIGDGLLDVLNRFNFTVFENDSIEQDIAVDPEMLGKVFENLLEIQDRKSKGAFYTPREIVRYMCQESIIEYLIKNSEDEISSDILKVFIKNHSTLQEMDFNESELTVIAENAIDLDQLLANILVCDPAVGSGAFPMGMLIEIVGARYALQPFLSEKQSMYELKLHTIRHSLYGVDIDPSAVDIARLRFWLSLIIEEEKPTPLPNLEHKLMQGNSLLSSYQGIELFNEEFITQEDGRQSQLDVIFEEVNTLKKELNSEASTIDISRIKAIKKRLISLEKQRVKIQQEGKNIPVTEMLFEVNDAFSKVKKQVDLLQTKISEFIFLDGNKNKDILKKEIDDLKWTLIEESIDNAKKAEEFNRLKAKSIQPFFIWKLEFLEVFKKKNGFDIVIGNPPYLRVQGIDREISEQYKSSFKAASGSYDLYVLFTEKGLDLLSKNGVLNFIMPHKWVNSAFGKGLREITKDKIKKLISFEAYQVFNASTYTSLVWFDKAQNKYLNYVGLEKNLKTNQELELFLSKLSEADYTVIKNESLGSDMWIFSNKIVKTILDKLNLFPLRAKDIFYKIFQGIATSKDSVYFLKNISEINETTLEGYSSELEKIIKIEKELAKPLLKGDGIHRYETLKTSMAVIFPYYIDVDGDKEIAKLYSEDQLSKKFPLGYRYLKECENVLRNRERGRLINDDYWFRYIYPKNLNMFNKEKIVMPYLSMGSQLSYDEYGKFYGNTKCFGLVKKIDVKEGYKFYLSILNSKLMWFFIKNTSSVMSGGYYTYTRDSLSPFPFPKIDNIDNTKPFESLVDQIIEGKKQGEDTTEKEKEIDTLVYSLYELTDDEISFIETN